LPDISDTIETVASDGVQSASVDGQSVDAVDISKLIEADKYLAAKAAGGETNSKGGQRSGWNGLRPARYVPKGGS
jgi:hypothetical protein